MVDTKDMKQTEYQEHHMLFTDEAGWLRFLFLEHLLAFSAASWSEQLQLLKYHKRVACPWWRGPASSGRVQVSWSLVDKKRWSVRATGGSVQQLCSRSVVVKKELQRQSSLFTGQSVLQISPMVNVNFGWWLKGEAWGYKRPKWVSSPGWLP